MIEKRPVTDRNEWLGWRLSDLTASDVAAAAGLDPYKSALQLYAEKTGVLMPVADNPMMRRGRWLESAVLAAFAERHPDWVIDPTKLYLRDTEIRLGATPDALAFADREPRPINIQCKVVSRPAFERHWAEGPPIGYQLQTACEAMLLDAGRSIVAALVIDTYSAELEEFEVPRHAGAEARIRSLAAEFWQRVAAGNPPPPDFSRDTEVIEQLHPVSVAEPVLDLSGDNRIASLLPVRAVLKEEIAGLEKDVAAIDAELKAKLGDAEKAQLPGWTISWKTQTRAEHVVKASSYRVLRVSEIEEKEEAA